ncbi:sugar ABC transporter substrate-binding protein [Bradyrhizobium lupini HPC(L)]|nr:sugar ABC transporter substrate-binding protein [Bradyrhizobium lupini HPC(L)]
MFNISVQRITQAIVGESTVDEAMARAKTDLEEALKQAK